MQHDVADGRRRERQPLTFADGAKTVRSFVRAFERQEGCLAVVGDWKSDERTLRREGALQEALKCSAMKAK